MLQLGEIHQSNAASLVRFLAEQLWHDISPGELDDVLSKIDSSNAAEGRWVELHLGEGPILILSLARDRKQGSTAVCVKAEASNNVLSQIRFVVLFLNRYVVRDEA